MGLVFFVGLVLMAQPWLEKELIKFEGQHYMQVSAKMMQKNAKKKAHFNTLDSDKVDVKDLVLHQMKGQSLPVIGLISIPSVNIHLPIFKGDGETTMCYGAGTGKANDVMGQKNYVLASHTVFESGMENLLFGPLKNIQVGDKIYLTDKAKVYLYRVRSLTQVSETQGTIANNHKGKRELTLYTCASYQGVMRWVVQGEFESSEKFDSRSAKVFEVPYNQRYR